MSHNDWTSNISLKSEVGHGARTSRNSSKLRWVMLVELVAIPQNLNAGDGCWTWCNISNLKGALYCWRSWSFLDRKFGHDSQELLGILLTKRFYTHIYACHVMNESCFQWICIYLVLIIHKFFTTDYKMPFAYSI